MLTSRAKYATRAILELSLRYGKGPMSLRDVADRQFIPLKFLEQIFVLLKGQGFVRSRRGPGGGYELTRSPAAISLGHVIRAVDGPLAPISCVSVTGFSECGCPEPETCGLRIVFKEARDAIASVLDSTSYEDIILGHGSDTARRLLNT